MHAIRRLYLYAVALISLETVLWGAIRLARSVLSGSGSGEAPSSLAGALSLVLVGIPVFGLHWWWVQRDVTLHPEERFEFLRALFLYGALLGSLVPVAQNLLSLLDRSLFMLFGLDPTEAPLGGGQSLMDNLVAILLNLAVVAILVTILRADWSAVPQGDFFAVTRRLYRYLWLFYGLGLAVYGVQQLLEFILGMWATVGIRALAQLANGLALLLVGLPVWLIMGEIIRRSLSYPAEARSVLRLGSLYILVFFSALGVLASAGLALYTLLRFLLGIHLTPAALLAQVNNPLSLAIPLGAVWAYYGKALSREIQLPVEAADGPLSPAGPALPSARPATRPRLSRRVQRGAEKLGLLWSMPSRADLRWLYYYTLALLGLITTFVGLHLLLAYLVELAFNGQVVLDTLLPGTLAAALAALLAGIPLWVLSWLPVQHGASLDGDVGDYARRSAIRKSYLFLVMFASVLGLMYSAGSMLFQLLRTLLGDPPVQPAIELAHQVKEVALFALLLGYHWRALRRDNRLAERILVRRRALYPVLVLSPDDGSFGEKVASALEREAAGVPVAVHFYSRGVPDETLSAARAVILPAELAARPSEAVRLWLQGFDGPHLVIPTPANGWYWVAGSGRSLTSLARQSAQIVRRMAEGEGLTPVQETSAWTVIVYILAGLFILELVAGLAAVAAIRLGIL